MSDEDPQATVPPLPPPGNLPEVPLHGEVSHAELAVFSREEAKQLKQLARAYPVIRKLVNSRLQWEAVGALGEFIKKWLVSVAVIGTSLLAGKAYLFDAIMKGSGSGQ